MLLLDEIPVVFIFLYCIDSSHLSTDAPQQVQWWRTYSILEGDYGGVGRGSVRGFVSMFENSCQDCSRFDVNYHIPHLFEIMKGVVLYKPLTFFVQLDQRVPSQAFPGM
jgi:hypothetical protein